MNIIHQGLLEVGCSDAPSSAICTGFHHWFSSGCDVGLDEAGIEAVIAESVAEGGVSATVPSPTISVKGDFAGLMQVWSLQP